jgi:hypothetical protein
VEADALEGQPMYFDAATGTYKRALAAVELDAVNGWYTVAQSSFVVGLLYSKSNTTTGSIISFGMARDFDLSNAVDDSTVSGPYYLSMTEAGKLVSARPSVGVYTLYNRGDDTVHVSPVQKDTLENHIHYKFDLVAAPAGDPNCIEYDDGQVHCIFDADSDLPGWLPADDPIFNGTAPEGAKFGYNLSQHPELLKVWPPQPPDTSYIEVNSHSVEVNSGTCPMVIVDCNGIWWMQDCYGAAPWSPLYDPCVSSSCGPEGSSSSGQCECLTPLEYLPGHSYERGEQMTLVMWFAKMVAKTNESVVTSLSPCSDESPIEFLNCEGVAASTGRLCAQVDFSKLAEVFPTAGLKVVKGFGPDQILTGGAITGLKPTSDIALTGIGTEGDDWDVDGDGVYRGEFEIALADRAGDPREGTPDLNIVSNVREDYDSVLKLFYLHYPAGQAGEVRGRIDVSRIDVPAGNLQMKLFFWFVGRSAGAMPELGVTYRCVPLITTPGALPTSDSNIGTGLWTPGVTLSAGQYVEVEMPDAYFFDITAGDQVFFSVTWDGSSGPSDGFGIIRSGYRIEVKP